MRINSLGAVESSPALNAFGNQAVIGAGPDGALWFTEPPSVNLIGRVDTKRQRFRAAPSDGQRVPDRPGGRTGWRDLVQRDRCSARFGAVVGDRPRALLRGRRRDVLVRPARRGAGGRPDGEPVQAVCTGARGDTAGLDQYCKIPGLEAALAAPAAASDTALVSACQASCAACARSGPNNSPSTCASVTTSASCFLHVDELEACLNEMTALGAAHGPSLPDCATLTRSSLGGVDQSLLIAAPSCGAIGSCSQILTSP